YGKRTETGKDTDWSDCYTISMPRKAAVSVCPDAAVDHDVLPKYEELARTIPRWQMTDGDRNIMGIGDRDRNLTKLKDDNINFQPYPVDFNGIEWLTTTDGQKHSTSRASSGFNSIHNYT